MKYGKIFCIGFSKTGTTSLHYAFRILGLKSCHHRHRGVTGASLIEKAQQDNKKLLEYMPNYHAYSDMGLFRFFKTLDQQYPESAFIFTYRDLHAWSTSKIKHDIRWNKAHPTLPARDVSEEQVQFLMDAHKRAYSEIHAYFHDSNNFLSIDITVENSWQPLCEFLALPIPKSPFPHSNRAKLAPKEAILRSLKLTFSKILYRSDHL